MGGGLVRTLDTQWSQCVSAFPLNAGQTLGKNRLTQVTLADTTTVDYAYDYQNRLVKREKVGDVRTFLYGTGNQVLEETLNGSRLALYGWGPRGLVSRTDANGNSLFFLKDGLSSVIAVIDERGTIVQSYEFSAAGESLSGKDAVNPFRFVGGLGGYTDDDTGLIQFWNRWYDPSAGRWVSEDPIRHFSMDLNFYRYALNNSGLMTDPNGLDPLIGGILGGFGGLINGLTQPCASLGDIGMSIAIGGTVGALVGLYDPTNIGAAAVAGLVSDLAVQVLAGKGIVWNDAAYSAMASAVAASVGRVAPVREAQVLYSAVLEGLGIFLGSANIDPNRSGCGCNN